MSRQWWQDQFCKILENSIREGSNWCWVSALNPLVREYHVPVIEVVWSLPWENGSRYSLFVEEEITVDELRRLMRNEADSLVGFVYGGQSFPPRNGSITLKQLDWPCEMLSLYIFFPHSEYVSESEKQRRPSASRSRREIEECNR
jgi:hypothetical protein